MLNDYSDKEIIEALRRKDPLVFRELFEAYVGQMVLFADYILVDRSEAEDVAQEIFVGLWNRTEFPEITSSFRSYIFTQVRNRCLNRIKHLNIEDKHGLWVREALDFAQIPDTEIDEELVGKKYKDIAELPEGCPTVFNLFVLEGKSHKEISELLHIKEHSSTSQLHRAKSLLMQKINEYIKYEERK